MCLTTSKVGAILLLLLQALKLYDNALQFKDIQCTVLNKNKMETSYCRLNYGKHNETSLSLRFKTTYGHVDDVKISLRYAKKTKGTRYKQQIPPIKFDFCTFLADERNPFYTNIFKLVKKYTNINHTCPYEMYDIIVHNFPLDESIFLWNSFQKSDYSVTGTFFLQELPSFSRYLSIKVPTLNGLMCLMTATDKELK